MVVMVKFITTLENEMKIIFRKWNDTKDIIAFFPESYGDSDTCNWGFMMSYEHVGQHSEADYQGLISKTTLAKPEEYAPLLKELQHIYKDDILVVVKQFRRK